MLPFLLLCVLSHEQFIPVGFTKADKISVTGVNDNSLRVEIDDASLWTQHSCSIKEFQINLLLGLPSVTPSIEFAIRIGYPRYNSGFYILKIDGEYVIATVEIKSRSGR